MKCCVGQASQEGLCPLGPTHSAGAECVPLTLSSGWTQGTQQGLGVSLGLCSCQGSGPLFCSGDGSCLSVCPAKPKALILARRLEPASWGQRSPSKASWHPGAMAAGRVRPSGRGRSRPVQLWETQPCCCYCQHLGWMARVSGQSAVPGALLTMELQGSHLKGAMVL